MFAVVKRTNFDFKVDIKLFNNMAEAERFLQADWEDTYNKSLPPVSPEYVSSLVEDECWHEDDKAQLIWITGDLILWTLEEVEAPK